MNRKSVLVETVSGKWLRVPSSFRKVGYVVDLPNGIALNVHSRTGCIEIYTRNEEDETYQFSGEMRFETDQKEQLSSTKMIYRNEPQPLIGY